ncbi:MAG: ATP synthase F1 subunit gamma [Actinobacteria bacterium]|jgi:F-type H+-transporting ATPase subunit gamma|nr:MAG: ATP synthase F1 subunit gamma [Actinomycetota bacterium]TML82642.1 MAG: ATP synthase F1 subunit gamma [Actinomycetota bacterium]
MATVQDIKRRVRSIRNTRKITRALELVAAAKLKRAQSRIEDMRPYADRMLELMAGTARASSSVRGLPLLQTHEQEQAVAIVPLTGDRGLAGAFNSQILRRALALERTLRGEGKQVRWVGVGRRGVGSLRFRRLELAAEFTGFTDQPRYADAQAIAHRVAELYTEAEVDRVILVYNHFESALVQQVTVQQILPLSEDLLESNAEERQDDAMRGDFIFEPEPEQILERLLPVYLETELYRALLESAASEHGARMTAMRNASRNAGELIDTLTLAMNRARQAEITQEILEVVAGADAQTG